jgi:3-dehydroquinate synthase
VADLFPRTGTILIADACFRDSGRLDAWGCPILWLNASEQEKTLATVERLISELLALQADRDTFLIGVGGGITTDITGFVAAIYKRGLRFGLVPTTLLAQVDAAIGGKNGVNFDRYKNMVGTFRQAEFVYIDTEFLQTLPARELRCGAAEMLKTFLLADAKAYEEAVRVFSGPTPERVPEHLVRRAGEIKYALVEQDPEDHGVRQLLNLGHTFGHAIEKCSSQYEHGEAVAIGIVMAARMACEKGLLQPEEADRIRRDIAACGLPVEPPVPEAELRAAILQDKKRTGDTLKYVLPQTIGQATLWEESVTA